MAHYYYYKEDLLSSVRLSLQKIGLSQCAMYLFLIEFYFFR